MTCDYENFNRELAALKRSPRFSKVFDLYQRETHDALKSTTRDRLFKAYMAHCEAIDNIRIDKFSPLLIQHLVLEKIFKSKHYHSVHYVCRLICQVLDFAVTVGLISSNPVSTIFNLPLVKRAKMEERKALQHRATLDYHHLKSELKKVLQVFKDECCLRQQLLLEINLRTILRPGECVRLKYSDLDCDRHLLKIENTKTKNVFLIPTCDSLETVLKRAYEEFGSEQGWLFRGYREHNLHISKQTLNKALKDHGFQGVLCAHGLRSVAANFFASVSTRILPHVAASCLQHVVSSSVERAYRRDDYLHDRRKAMKLWNDYLDELYATLK